jgi:hypothetical protein
MLYWIVDNVHLFYLAFGLAALALAAWWWRTRDARYLVAAGAAAALLGLAVVLSLLVMTDRKQLVADVHDVVGKMNRGDFDGAFRRFADKIELKWGNNGPFLVSRAVLRGQAEGARKNPRAGAFRVWDVEVEELDGARGVVSFYISTEDAGGRYAVCKARCKRVGDLKWRVVGLDVDFPAGGAPPVTFPPR